MDFTKKFVIHKKVEQVVATSGKAIFYFMDVDKDLFFCFRLQVIFRNDFGHLNRGSYSCFYSPAQLSDNFIARIGLEKIDRNFERVGGFGFKNRGFVVVDQLHKVCFRFDFVLVT